MCARKFDEVADMFADLTSSGSAATPSMRRILVECITVLPDYLEVIIAGASKLNVRFEEVGLEQSENGGVGGAFAPSTHAIWRTEWAA